MAKITIALLGNIQFDTRSYNLMKRLQQSDHKVRFIGFDWLTRDFETYRSSNILIKKMCKGSASLLFYIKFAILITFFLFHQRADIYWAADFYCFPFCFCAAKIFGGVVFYDSRELFTEINGLITKPGFRSWVKRIEGYLIKRTKAVFVTGIKDAEYLEALYRIPQPYLLRNLPMIHEHLSPIDYRKDYGLKVTGKILLYQGILVHGRGINACLRILQQFPDYGLVLLGGGEHETDFRKMAMELKILDRIVFAGKIVQHELLRFTAGGDIGLALIENISKNNELALPNKLFEYIMAGLPVIVTDLPQMSEIVQQYQIGATVPDNDLVAMMNILKTWDDDPSLFERLKHHCIIASRKLNWETEFSKIDYLFKN